EALALAEHVLGAAQADALGAVASGLGGLLGLVGVGPDLHPPDLVGPGEDLLELGLVLEASLDRRELAEVEVAGRAVEAQPGALFEVDARDQAGCRLRAVVDGKGGRSRDARLADLASDDRGMRRG